MKKLLSDLTPGEWKAVPYENYGRTMFEIHYTKDGECAAEVIHNEADAQVMATSKKMVTLLQYFIKENMLSIAGQEMAEEMVEEALKPINPKP